MSEPDSTKKETPKTRRLDFPEETPLGRLWTRLPMEEWRHAGEARGTVEIPDGARVRLAVHEPPNLRGLPPEGIHEIRAHGLQLRPGELKPLSRMKHLEVLSLAGSLVTSQELKELLPSEGLRALDLTQTQVEDSFANILGEFQALEVLIVNDTDVGDALAEAAAKLPHLRSFRCAISQVTDDGVAAISRVAGLQELELPHAWISEKGYQTLAQLQSLRVLLLALANPTPISLAVLKKLPRLEILTLPPTLDDAGILTIQAMPALRLLWSEGENITHAGLAALRSNEKLQMLALHNSVDQAEAEALIQLPALERLDLRMKDVPLAALDKLAEQPRLTELRLGTLQLHDGTVSIATRLKHLKRWHLYDSSLTAHGVESLRDNLPDTQLTHTPAHLPVENTGAAIGKIYSRPWRQAGETPWREAPRVGHDWIILRDHEISYHTNVELSGDLLRLAEYVPGQVAELRLTWCKLTKEDVEAISKMQNLATIELHEVELADEFYDALPLFPKLQWLVIDTCGTTDADAAQIARCEKLLSLHLRGSAITKKGLKEIGALPKLKSLDIAFTKLPESVVRNFREEHTGMDIVF